MTWLERRVEANPEAMAAYEDELKRLSSYNWFEDHVRAVLPTSDENEIDKVKEGTLSVSEWAELIREYKRGRTETLAWLYTTLTGKPPDKSLTALRVVCSPDALKGNVLGHLWAAGFEGVTFHPLDMLNGEDFFILPAYEGEELLSPLRPRPYYRFW